MVIVCFSQVSTSAKKLQAELDGMKKALEECQREVAAKRKEADDAKVCMLLRSGKPMCLASIAVVPYEQWKCGQAHDDVHLELCCTILDGADEADQEQLYHYS